MIKENWFLFVILLLELAALMAVELMGAKLLSPFYGSSLYVWTSVLSITVFGLTLGYHFGGKLPQEKNTQKRLLFIITIAAILVLLLPITASFAIYITSKINLITGILIASSFVLVPPMFLFGLVGAALVGLMEQKNSTGENSSGLVKIFRL